MTTEYIKRVSQLLQDHEIEFVITGGVAQLLRGNKSSTLDFDVLIKMEEENLERLDDLAELLKLGKNKISRILIRPEIVRLKIYPFTVDIIPKLDGLETEEVFKEKDIFDFEGLEVPMISEFHLLRNYEAINKKKR